MAAVQTPGLGRSHVVRKGREERKESQNPVAIRPPCVEDAAERDFLKSPSPAGRGVGVRVRQFAALHACNRLECHV